MSGSKLGLAKIITEGILTLSLIPGSYLVGEGEMVAPGYGVVFLWVFVMLMVLKND